MAGPNKCFNAPHLWQLEWATSTDIPVYELDAGKILKDWKSKHHNDSFLVEHHLCLRGMAELYHQLDWISFISDNVAFGGG